MCRTLDYNYHIIITISKFQSIKTERCHWKGLLFPPYYKKAFLERRADIFIESIIDNKTRILFWIK